MDNSYLFSFLSKILIIFVKWKTKPFQVGKVANAFDTMQFTLVRVHIKHALYVLFQLQGKMAHFLKK